MTPQKNTSVKGKCIYPNLRQPPPQNKVSAKKKYFTINYVHLIHEACQILHTFTNQCHCDHLHSQCLHLPHTHFWHIPSSHCHSTKYCHQILMLLIPCIFLHSIYHPKYAPSDTPFTTYINSSVVIECIFLWYIDIMITLIHCVGYTALLKILHSYCW